METRPRVAKTASGIGATSVVASTVLPNHPFHQTYAARQFPLQEVRAHVAPSPDATLTRRSGRIPGDEQAFPIRDKSLRKPRYRGSLLSPEADRLSSAKSTNTPGSRDKKSKDGRNWPSERTMKPLAAKTWNFFPKLKNRDKSPFRVPHSSKLVHQVRR